MRFGPPAWDLQKVIAATGANSWGFFLKASSLTCERYNDLIFLNSQRGTISYGGGDTLEGPVTLIPIDSEGLVGDGSIVFKAGATSVATSIFVWDVLGADLYERTLTAGDRATTPVFVGGYLWWLEWQIAFVNPCTVSLMRSRADLSGVTELETFSLAEQNGNAGGAQVELVVPSIASLAFTWRTGNEDGHNQLQVWNKNFAAGVPTEKTDDWATALGIRPNVDNTDWLDGTIVGAGLYDPGEATSYLSATVATTHDDGFDGGFRGRLQTYAGTSPSDLWPNNAGLWEVSSVALSVGGDFAQVSNGSGIILRHDRSTPIEAGDPLISAEVEGDGDLNLPNAVFYIGASA